jgi:uncharacterized membrane protein YphA (DoxX/SURF4 family)
MHLEDRSHDSPSARHDPLALDVATRLNYLRLVVVGAYVCGIVLSPRLWFGVGRTFPRIPVVSGLPAFILVHDYLLSILLLAALILATVVKRPNAYLVAAVVLTALLVVFDLTRLQPWVYQYVLMLAVLAYWRALETTQSILFVLRLVMATLYFWSGVQKLNWSFGHEVFPGLLSGAGIHLPATFGSYLPVLAILVGACEMLIGIGLLVRRTRKASVLLALVMHVLVLVLLLVARRNNVVWPWNVGMMAMVVLLFRRFDHSIGWRKLWSWQGTDLLSYLPRVVIILCALMPALSFPGWWDLYLSAALYSGSAPVGVARISEQVRGRLPLGAQQQVFATGRGELILPFYEWSLAELNVPPYPEARAYRQIARQVCIYEVSPGEVQLIVKERPALIDGSYVLHRSDCVDLLSR